MEGDPREIQESLKESVKAGRHAAFAIEAAQSECGGYRLWVHDALRGRTTGSRPTAGALVPDLHRRPPSVGRVAPRLWSDDGGHGGHGRLLDSDLRDPGGTWAG